MKIAYITSQFPVPSETFAAGDVLELVRRGHEVSVFGFRPDHPDMAAMVRQRGLEHIPVENIGLSGQLSGLLRMMGSPALALPLILRIIRSERRPGRMVRSLLLLPAFFRILSRLKRLKPDLVHLFWGHYPSILGLLLKRSMPEVKLSIFLGAHDLAAKMPLSAHAARQADAVFTHARANLSLLEEMGIPASAVTVVHRGVDTDALERQLSGAPAAKDPDLVVTAGRLQSYKGFDDTLRVFARLHRGRPRLRLAVLGDGPDRPSLERLVVELGITESVRFYGHLPHDRVITLMAEASLFIFMSRHDGERLPNSVKEAMFCRCICISSDTVGIEELIDHGKSGFIVPAGDAAAAAELAGKALDGAYPEMPEAARRTILEDFSRSRAMGRYLDVWSG